MTIFIDFASTSDTPSYYAFEQTGDTNLVLGSGSGSPPSDHWFPTGKEIGRYSTLAEARTANPSAHVKKNAFRACVARGA